MALPAIEQRPTPLHPSVESWTELQAWIDKQLENIDSSLGDDETLQSIGPKGQARLGTRWALLTDIAEMIHCNVVDEADEAARTAYEEAAEAEYREAYGPDFDKLATFQAEGR